MSQTTNAQIGNRHTNSAVRTLREMAEGDGGHTLVAIGGAALDIGVRRPAAATLLEAVLAVTADRRYERIACFTDVGEHMPHDVAISDTFAVGSEAGGWLLRGTWPSVTPANQRREERDPDELDAGALFRSAAQSGPEARQIYARAPGAWVIELDQLLKQLELGTGREWQGGRYASRSDVARPPRSLLILDESLLIPRQPEHYELGRLLNRGQALEYKRRLGALPEMVRGTPVDLVLLARSPATLNQLQRGRFIAGEVERMVREEYPQGASEQQLAGDPRIQGFPAIQWDEKAFDYCQFETVDATAPHGPFWAGSPQRDNLYSVLRSIPAKPPKSLLRPPRDPRRLMVEFWSRIDLESLQDRLHRDVIGQRSAIRRVLDALADFRERCQDVLAAGREPPANKDYFPPVFLFMGESGMGKTHLAETIAKQLFGEGFAEIVKLTARSPEDELLGGKSGYIGYDDETFLQKICRRTNGLGLVVFDEFDKVERPQSNRLDQAVSPFLEALDGRSVIPRNPNFTNYGDRLWFRNLLIVFTANVLESGQRPGYELLSSFGTPMLGRLEHKIMFTELESSDVEPAIRFFLGKYLRRVVTEMMLEG
ncbi:MAG TPA: AAA family ATPase, partial [Pirellulaceae bacterium]|nr:AAA family ATPase [Pirellulaceae bacterium]